MGKPLNTTDILRETLSLPAKPVVGYKQQLVVQGTRIDFECVVQPPPPKKGVPMWQFDAVLELRDGHRDHIDAETQLCRDFGVHGITVFVPEGIKSGIVKARVYLPLTVGRA